MSHSYNFIPKLSTIHFEHSDFPNDPNEYPLEFTCQIWGMSKRLLCPCPIERRGQQLSFSSNDNCFAFRDAFKFNESLWMNIHDIYMITCTNNTLFVHLTIVPLCMDLLKHVLAQSAVWTPSTCFALLVYVDVACLLQRKGNYNGPTQSLSSLFSSCKDDIP